MNRRSFLLALAATPTLAAVASACGDKDVVEPDDQPTTGPTGAPAATSAPPATSGAGAITHPTGADEIVLRLGYEGGFVPVGTAFVNLPTLLLAGDGAMFRPGAQTMIYPGPLLPAISTATVTEAGVQRVLALADGHGLLATPPDYSTEVQVADAPDTVLTITANGQTFVHRAPALGIVPPAEGADDGSAGEETSEARRQLQAFVTAVTDLGAVVGVDAIGPETVLSAAAYRLQGRPTTEAAAAGQDPQPTVVAWPATADVRLADTATCARTTSPDVIAALQAATSITVFTEGEQRYELAAAAVLPGDPVC